MPFCFQERTQQKYMSPSSDKVVGEQHLRPTELVVRCVHLAAQQLVQGGVAGQDDGLVGALYAAAAQACQVCSDADRAARHQRDREALPGKQEL